MPSFHKISPKFSLSPPPPPPRVACPPPLPILHCVATPPPVEWGRGRHQFVSGQAQFIWLINIYIVLLFGRCRDTPHGSTSLFPSQLPGGGPQTPDTGCVIIIKVSDLSLNITSRTRTERPSHKMSPPVTLLRAEARVVRKLLHQ